MLARTVLRRAALARTYATAAPDAAPPPVPLSKAPLYDQDREPALAAMGYPELSRDSRQLRSPRGWWDNQERVRFGEPVPENDDIQSMWAPDVHAVKPSSALTQLLLAFGAVGLFALGVYEIRGPAPMLPRAYPHDGLVKELSGTSDASFAARTEAENQVEE
ncbi:hypothetical protein JCM10450v2_002471 [Rhodotorula kratochvilovae]